MLCILKVSRDDVTKNDQLTEEKKKTKTFPLIHAISFIVRMKATLTMIIMQKL